MYSISWSKVTHWSTHQSTPRQSRPKAFAFAVHAQKQHLVHPPLHLYTQYGNEVLER